MIGAFQELLLPLENFSFQKQDKSASYKNKSTNFILHFLPKEEAWGINFLSPDVIKNLNQIKYDFSQSFKSIYAAKKQAAEMLKFCGQDDIDLSLKRTSANWYDIFDEGRDIKTPISINGFSGQWQHSTHFICLYQIQQQLKNISFVSNAEYTTRQASVQCLHNLVAEYLPDIFDLYQYVYFNLILQSSKPQTLFNNQAELWWCFFVKPEVDLTKVF